MEKSHLNNAHCMKSLEPNPPPGNEHFGNSTVTVGIRVEYFYMAGAKK